MTQRMPLHVSVPGLALEHERVGADQDLAGDPTTAFAALTEFNGLEVGVWEMSTGAMSDTEADEVFVVISGRATVEFIDEGRCIELAPGDLVRLAEGQRTVWTVTEPLRKVYVTPL